MSKIWKWITNNPNRAMFLVPILLVAGISISHVVAWYNIANPINWAIYLSIAIEVGAMTALVAATNKIKGGVWFMFGIVTFIQMIGNIFFCFKEIDSNGELFKSWVELTGPVWDMLGSDITDIIAMKRWLAFLEGGLLPIISLTSLHFFIKYEETKFESKEEKVIEDGQKEEIIIEENKELNKVNDEVIETEEPIIEEQIIESENLPEQIENILIEEEKEEVIEEEPINTEIIEEPTPNLYIPPTPNPQPEKRRLMYIKPI